MSSFGEHLAALAAVGAGLQIRVHRMHTDLQSTAASNNRPSFFKDSEYDKVRKSLDKNFPKRELAAKEKGWERLNEPARAQQISSELLSHYECIRECAKYRDAVLSALRRAPGTILRDPRGSIPTEEQFWPGLASRSCLDLLCVFGRLHIQIERLGGDLRALVAGYNSAYFSLQSRDEDDFAGLVSPFCKQFEETTTHSLVIRHLIADLVKNDESVVDLVSYLLEKVRHWFVSGTNKHHNVWQIDTFACMLTEPMAQASEVVRCAPVCFRERARSWVIWGLLLCPGAIASSRTKYSETARLESLLRLVLSENVVESVCREQTIRLHDEFFEVFNVFPGKQHPLVKERFESFLTAKPKKLVNECAVECSNRAALVHRERRVILAQLLLNTLTQLRVNRATMGPKFPSVLALLAASKDELGWYFTHHRCSAPKVHSTGVINLFLGGTSQGDTGNFSKEDWIDPVRVGVLFSMHTALYEEARQSWWIGEQYSTELLRGQFAFECLRRGLLEHADALEHKSNFDLKLLELRNETLVQPSTGSMYSTCSGFGDEFLPQLFFHLVMLEDDGSGGDPIALRTFASLSGLVFSPHLTELFEDALKDQPRHCLAYFDLLSSAQDVLSPYCPEEFPTVGEVVCGLADQFLYRVQIRLQESLDDLAGERRKLESQYEATKAIDRLLLKQTQKQQQQLLPSTTGPQPNNRNGLDLKPGFESKPRYREYTSKLAKAQRGVRGICASLGRQASNSVLIWNRTYALREYLRETITQWLEGKVRGAFLLYKPSHLQQHLARTFDIVRFACEHGGFDSGILIRQVWLKETSEEAGTLLDLAKQSLIQFLDTRLNLYVYSDFAKAFVRYPAPVVTTEDGGGEWLDAGELQCLYQVLGARGGQAVTRQLTGFVTDLAAKVKRLLLENESTLQDFKRADSSQQDVMRHAKAVKRGEEVVQTLRVLGATLQLGELVLGKCANLLGQVEINPLIWSLLPFCVSASLVGSGEFWKSADFVLRLDCHANNAHLVGLGVVALLQRTQEPARLHSREVDFIRSFALVLLGMKKDQTGEYRDWPLRGATMFLEKVVQQSSTLTPKMLDAFLPSPLLQAAVIDRTLGKVHGADAGMGVDELANVIQQQLAAEGENTEEGAPVPSYQA
ncbi:hypothetical protein BASA81_002299 [Batrachochytrium salamandrivorans]|nr:hypothetical protein BASA81_002299 [Batrachochytrium salamandrivorans]